MAATDATYFGSGVNLLGSSLYNSRLHIITGIGDFTNPAEGMIGWRNRRIATVDQDNTTIIESLRRDLPETITGLYTFDRNAGNVPPIAVGPALPAVGSTLTMVTHLNANYVQGYATSASHQDPSTLIVRDSSGRARVATAVNDFDATPLKQVNDLIAGRTASWKFCRFATTGNINLSSAPATFDGGTPATNDRILVHLQTAAAENGPYIWNGSGSAMTRAADADEAAEFQAGKDVFVDQGSTYANKTFRLLELASPFTLGTDPVNLSVISGAGQITAGSGLDKSGDTIYVKLGSAGAPSGTPYTHGGIVYASGNATLDHVQLTGMVKANGASAPTAVTGTSNRVSKWTNANTIGDSSITDDGTSITTTAASVQVTPASLSAHVRVFKATGEDGRIEANSSFVNVGSWSNHPVRFLINALEKWQITAAGVLQSDGAQTIQTSGGVLTVTGTGGLTLSTAANTNITLSPNGSGVVNLSGVSNTYLLTVNTGGRGVVAKFAGPASEAGYLNSFAAFIPAYRAEINGSGTWTARGTSASIVELAGGEIRLYADTGLTDGNTFSPTLRATLNAAGLALPGDLEFTGGGGITTTSNGNLVLSPHGTGFIDGVAARFGNLYIGDSTPNTTGGRGQFKGQIWYNQAGDNALHLFAYDAGGIYFHASGGGGSPSTQLFIQGSTGNVGIAETNPADFKLQLAGNIGPSTNNAHDIGSASKRIRDVHAHGFRLPVGQVQAITNAKPYHRGLHFDGVTSGTRVTSTLTSQSVGTGDFSVWVRFDVPGSNPSTIQGVVGFSSSATAIPAANAFGVYLDTDGTLKVRLYGATTSDHRTASVAGFVANFGGTRPDLVVTRAGTTLKVYINGVDTAFTESTGGTPPAWSGSITSTNLNLGVWAAAEIFKGVILRAAAFNVALAQADIDEMLVNGVPYRFKWGSHAEKISDSDDRDFATSGHNWVAVGTGASVAHDGTNQELDVTTGSTTGVGGELPVGSFGNATAGKRYRLKYTIRNISSGNLTVKAGGATISGSRTNGTFTDEFNATSNAAIQLLSNSASQTWSIDDIALSQIGAFVDLDMENADPALSTTVQDRSGNQLNGTATASGIEQTIRMEQLMGRDIVVKSDTFLLDSIGLKLGLGRNDPLGELHAKAAAPRFLLEESDAAVNNRLWDWYLNGEQLQGRVANDADSTQTAWIQIDRTATTVDTVNFPNGDLQAKGKNVLRGHATTVTGAGTSHTINHNLATKKLDVILRNQTSKMYGRTGFKATDSGGTDSDNHVTLLFDYAPGSTVYDVFIIAFP